MYTFFITLITQILQKFLEAEQPHPLPHHSRHPTCLLGILKGDVFVFETERCCVCLFLRVFFDVDFSTTTVFQPLVLVLTYWSERSECAALSHLSSYLCILFFLERVCKGSIFVA